MPGRLLEVFLTVDVEHAGASHVRAHPDHRYPPRSLDCGDKEDALGLPYIVSVLRRSGLRATFFMESLASHYYGPQPLASAVSTLLKDGQDVQLHAHPAWLRFADGRERSDWLYAYSSEEQESILREARRLLVEGGAPDPSAYRAGGFGADDRTYAALSALGFSSSSSYNLSCLGSDCRISKQGRRNDTFTTGNLIEIPLTSYLVRDPRRAFAPVLKHFQVGNTRFRHGRRILEKAREAGMRCVNILLHNFEFVRRRGPLWFLGPFEPHRAVMESFEALCAYLAANPGRYAVRTFGELDAGWGRAIAEGSGNDPLPRAGGIYWPM